MSILTEEQFFTLFDSAMRANRDAAGRPLPDDVFDVRAASLFYALTEEMLRVNAHMNLTAITEIPDILVKHYADCALTVPYIPAGAVLCDVGCGGGFPSLPIAILRPDVTVTAVDSTAKKLDYVARTAAHLGLDNLSVVCARAETLGLDPAFRGRFDIVTARAVARMNVLCEWCLPLVKRGGSFLAMKGRSGEEEHTEAQNAISVLGGKTELCRTYTLFDPFSDTDASADAKRCLIVVKKQKDTPAQYPRANAQIAKKPL